MADSNGATPALRPIPGSEPDSGARSTYLGANRAGREFWLSGPHVFSASEDGARLRHVCALARFNRRGRSRGRYADTAAEGPSDTRPCP